MLAPPWRRLLASAVVAGGLAVLGSAEAKPTRLGEPTNDKPGPTPVAPAPTTSSTASSGGGATRETTRDGKKKVSPECRACSTECDAKRIHCVPGCGKAKVDVDARHQKCVAFCFNRATTCHRECQKTRCKD